VKERGEERGRMGARGEVEREAEGKGISSIGSL
jgi:hypothetical protein